MIEDTPQVRTRFALVGILGADWQDAWVGGICRRIILTGLLHMCQTAKGI